MGIPNLILLLLLLYSLMHLLFRNLELVHHFASTQSRFIQAEYTEFFLMY